MEKVSVMYNSVRYNTQRPRSSIEKVSKGRQGSVGRGRRDPLSMFEDQETRKTRRQRIAMTTENTLRKKRHRGVGEWSPQKRKRRKRKSRDPDRYIDKILGSGGGFTMCCQGCQSKGVQRVIFSDLACYLILLRKSVSKQVSKKNKQEKNPKNGARHGRGGGGLLVQRIRREQCPIGRRG